MLELIQHSDSRTDGHGRLAVVVMCVASVHTSPHFALCQYIGLPGGGQTCAFDAGGFVRT